MAASLHIRAKDLSLSQARLMKKNMSQHASRNMRIRTIMEVGHTELLGRKSSKEYF